MNLYRIRNWQDLYENNRTRELKTIKWIPFPVKLSGDGYCQIMEEKNGPAIFGTFVALVEMSAQCDPRGTLIRSSGEPHTFLTIGRICRINPTLIEQTIYFTSQKLNWVEIINLDDNCGEIAQRCEKGATTPSLPFPSFPSLQEGLKGGFENQKYAKRSKIFIPPTFKEFEKYCKDNNFEHIAKKAFEYYSTADWHDGKGNPVKNWKQKLQGVWFDERKNPRQQESTLIDDLYGKNL
jgi:hypothetical protein